MLTALRHLILKVTTLPSAAQRMREDPSSIFTAVESAGIKSELRKGPVEVLIVNIARLESGVEANYFPLFSYYLNSSQPLMFCGTLQKIHYSELLNGDRLLERNQAAIR